MSETSSPWRTMYRFAVIAMLGAVLFEQRFGSAPDPATQSKLIVEHVTTDRVAQEVDELKAQTKALAADVFRIKRAIEEAMGEKPESEDR